MAGREALTRSGADTGASRSDSNRRDMPQGNAFPYQLPRFKCFCLITENKLTQGNRNRSKFSDYPKVIICIGTVFAIISDKEIVEKYWNVFSGDRDFKKKKSTPESLSTLYIQTFI